VLVEGAGSVFGVDGTRYVVAWIDADLARVTFDEPVGHGAEKSAGDSLAAAFCDGVDPFDLGVALKAASEMACDKTYDLLTVGCDEGCAWSEGLLREKFSIEVGRDAALPVGLGLPLLCADGRHCWNVGRFGGTDGDGHGISEFLRITFFGESAVEQTASWELWNGGGV
jgi:hypothetical protein